MVSFCSPLKKESTKGEISFCSPLFKNRFHEWYLFDRHLKNPQIDTEKVRKSTFHEFDLDQDKKTIANRLLMMILTSTRRKKQ